MNQTFPYIGQSDYATVLFLFKTTAHFAQGLCLKYDTVPHVVGKTGSWNMDNFRPFKGTATIGENFSVTIEKLT